MNKAQHKAAAAAMASQIAAGKDTVQPPTTPAAQPSRIDILEQQLINLRQQVKELFNVVSIRVDNLENHIYEKKD